MKSTTRVTLTVEEAAAILGIGRTSAYAAARAGELPCIRIGGRILVIRAGLEALLRCPVPRQDPPASGAAA